jgi:hypothetical protein
MVKIILNFQFQTFALFRMLHTFFSELRKSDSNLKNNSLTWFNLLTRNRAILPHTLTRWLYVGRCLHNLFSLPASTPNTSFRGAQAIFQAKPFHAQSITLSTTVTLHNYPPIKMEQTECSKTLAFKPQTPGNNPEESIRQECLSLYTERTLTLSPLMLYICGVRLPPCGGNPTTCDSSSAIDS